MDSLPATVASALVEADSETDWPARWQALTAVSVELQSLLVTDPGPELVALIEQILTQLADGVATSRRHRVELAELAHRVLGTHARACAETGPDPVRLADWLLDLQLQHPDAPDVSLSAYTGALDDEGLARYRERAVTLFEPLPVIGFGETGRYDRARWALLRIMEELAEYSEDVDLQLLVLSKDLSSGWHYLQVATVLRDNARSDEALEWVERGLRAVGGRGAALRLIDLAVEEHLRRGRPQRAVEVCQEAFFARPNLDVYLKIRALVVHTDEWPPLRAALVNHLVQDGSRLAVEVYRRIVEVELARRGIEEQELVIELLHQLRGLQPDAFADYLEHIKSRHVADRELLDELSRRGL
jgi:tetratricopeptide (TPR) repeat protein